MAWKIAKTSGNLSSAGTWYDGNHNAGPDSYSGSNYLDMSATRYSQYFTPSNASDECVGGCFLLYRNGSAAFRTLVCDLMQGTSAMATSTTYMKMQAGNDDYGPMAGWMFMKFATSTTYGNTSVGVWRYRLSDAGLSDTMRFRRTNATELAYIEVLGTSTAPVSQDTLMITAALTSENVSTSVAVTIDTSFTAGVISSCSIAIGKGGSLSWGTSQNASHTLTCAGNIMIHSSKSNELGFAMGTSTNPLTSSYIQAVFFTDIANRNGIRVNDLLSSNILYNYNPPRVSIWGNWQFNQASPTSWRSTLAAGSSSGQKTVILTDDLGLRAGGGDALVLEGTNNSNDTEVLVTSTYDAPTKTITCVNNLSDSHATNAPIYLYSANAYISGNTNTSGTYMLRSLNNYGTTRKDHYEVSYLEGYLASDCCTPSADETSVMQYVRSNRGVRDATVSNFSPSLGKWMKPVQNCVAAQTLGNLDAGLNNAGRYENNIFFNHSGNGLALVVGTSNYYLNCRFLDCYASIYGESDITFDTCIFRGGSGNQSIYFNNANMFKIIFIDCVQLAPDPNFFAIEVANDLTFEAVFLNFTYSIANLIDESNLVGCNAGTFFKFQTLNGNTDDCRIYQPEGALYTTGVGLTDSLTRTAGEISLKLSPYDSAESAVTWSITKVIKSNQTASWYGYFRKNSFYGSATLPSVTLTSDDGAISSTSTITDVDDTWVFFSVFGQVGAANTSINLTLTAQSVNASAAAYFADMQLVIGDVTAGTATGFKVGTLWGDGEPTADDILGGTVDGSFLGSEVWGNSSALTLGKFLGLK